MSTVLIALIRLYLRVLSKIAPRFAGQQAYGLFSKPRLRAPIPKAVAEVMERAESFTVLAEGQTVAAYRWSAVDSGESPAPRVMLVHGWESRAARLAVWVDPLLKAGFEVVAFDAPAHGNSEGRRADPLAFAAAINAVADRVGAPTACVCHSLGGLAAMLAVAGRSLHGRPELTVHKLVIIAGAESGVDAMSMFCQVLGLGDSFLPLILSAAAGKAGRPVADFDAHRFFAQSTVPTLWLHSSDDQEVPLAAAQRVDRSCPHVTLETQDELGHRQIARDPAIIARGLHFLQPLRPSPEASAAED